MNAGAETKQSLNSTKFANIYHPLYNLESIPEEDRELMKEHDINDTFPAAVVILLHFLTLGIFSFLYMGMRHSRLPRIRHDDFGAGKAIGFMLIPIVSAYWAFMFWVRLASRINFQFRLRNLPEPVPRGLVITAVIVSLIPFFGFLAWMILFPACIGFMQSACNQLARIYD